MVLKYFNIYGPDIKSLRGMEGVIDVPIDDVLQKVPLSRYCLVKHTAQGSTFSFVGKVCSIGQKMLSFDVLAAESKHPRYQFNIGVPFNELVSCRLLKANDMPRLINWAWIGPELRRKFFKVGV